MKIYHYEKDGLFIGEGKADADPMQSGEWLIPAYATNIKPPEHIEGKTRNFILGNWEYIEIPIHETANEPVQPTKQEIRKSEILFELENIDRESIRPARAVAVSIATETQTNEFDIRKLQSLEKEAADLRAELSLIQ